jgi:DNA-binding transcriptional regulator YiaG
MKCGNCGKNSLETAKVRHEVNVDGARFVGMLPGHTCTSCKDTTIGLDDLTRFEHAVALSLAEHGPVGGASLRYMRKSIPLSAASLAELLRVAPETVSRWETGERAVDRASWLVVRGLLLDPRARQDIAKLADEPPARPVAIAV